LGDGVNVRGEELDVGDALDSLDILIRFAVRPTESDWLRILDGRRIDLSHSLSLNWKEM